eukprot:gene3219-5534_t
MSDKNKKKFYPQFITQSLDHLYNSEYEKCKTILEPKEDYCPFSCYILSEMYLINGLIAENQKDRDRALKYCKMAETFAYNIQYTDETLTEYLKKTLGKKFNSKNEELIKQWKIAINIVEADCILVKGIGNLIFKEYVSAAWNINKAFKIYDRNFKIHSEEEKKENGNSLHPEILLNLKFGMGIFYYMISLIPYPSIQSILSVFGYVGDAESGIEYMEDVRKNNGLHEGWAMSFLMVSYLYIPSGIKKNPQRLKQAEIIAKVSKKKYPKGALSTFFSGLCMKHIGEPDGAIPTYLDLISQYENNGATPNFITWELANAYYMKADWKHATELLEKIIKAESFPSLAVCKLELASCYAICDRMEESKEMITSLISMKGDFSSKLASDKIPILSKIEDTKMGLIMILFEFMFFRNFFEKLKPDIAEYLLDTEMKYCKEKIAFDSTKPEDLDLVLSYQTIKATILLCINKKKEAEELLKSAIALRVAAYYSLSSFYFNEENYDDSYVNIVRCTEFSGYPREQMWKYRIKKATEEIKTFDIKEMDVKKSGFFSYFY